jgi:protein-S-isoprenylcysteine O-methyltransferase Ste14
LFKCFSDGKEKAKPSGVGYPLSVNGETLSRFGGPCAVAILVDDLRMKIDHARVVAPPPLLMVLCIAAGFLAEHFQHFQIFPAHHPIRRPLCFALFGAAVIIFVTAIRELIRHKTHPSPYKATAALVQTGIYRFSRNPIYVGFLLVVLGCAMCADSGWLLLAAVALFVLLRFGVVSREEQYLSRKFGDVYEEYRRKVRRWM